MTTSSQAPVPFSIPAVGTFEAVSPALQRYNNDVLFGNLWQRPELSARDRSIISLSSLIARNHTAALEAHLDMALDSGVSAAEISEIITHLAFYSGWGVAMSAVPVVQAVFTRRAIAVDQLPGATVPFLPMDADTEAKRAAMAEQSAGKTAPGLVQFTTEALFHDLWLRPDLAPRDRGLVTVSALVSAGQVAQITYHLNRAMDNGLTQAQASEAITHLAFYAGWPNAFSSVPVAKDVFEKRPV